MKVSVWTRRALAVRRRAREFSKERASMLKDGWELVDDRGGNLWSLNRGSRMGMEIKRVRIAADGQSLWVQIGERA